MSERSKAKTKDEAVARRIRAAAARALEEAEARRKASAVHPQESESQKRELGGRDGPEPVRYGDWEVKGIASDF